MIASFHVIHYRRRNAARGPARAGVDRWSLGRVPGLRFARPLISGLGRPDSPSALPVPHFRRSALFAVWDDDAALDGFLADSAVARRWSAHASETWHVRLEPLRAHGTWGGQALFADARGAPPADGPGAMLTFINLRPRGQLPFWRIVDKVARELSRHPGFLAGFLGTEPVPVLVRNVTFTLWSSLEQAMGFAYRRPGSCHEEAMRRTADERWASEMLFARLRPYASAGTLGGRDPLAALNLAGGSAGQRLVAVGGAPGLPRPTGSGR